MKRLTAEWVKKAEADFVVAGLLARMKAVLHDRVCFYSQRAAEMYLKALLQELGLTVPRTHDLTSLLLLLSPHQGSLLALRRGLEFLSRFAEGPGYPGFTARKRQAAGALRWVRRVRDACCSRLGIKPPHRREKG
jgi:HEPN domain-containing protein